MSGLIYFQDGNVVANSGDVSVYDMNDELFLEIGPGHTLWALEREVSDYLVQLQDLPRGNCLEVGLGLGVASRCILTYPHVDRLTTIEINNDVIATHKEIISILDSSSRTPSKWLPYDGSKHKIVHMDGLEYLYTTRQKFDFIFLDFWQFIDDSTLAQIADMVRAAKRVLADDGNLIGWIDPQTDSFYVEEFNKLLL